MGEAPLGTTNQRALLNDIDEWRLERDERVCLVTFNYDKMLERAFEKMSITFSDIASYIVRDDYKLIKAHGSIDWVHATISEMRHGRTNDDTEIQNVISKAGQNNLVVGKEFIVDNANVNWTDRGNGNYSVLRWFPALAIPIQNKAAFECPDSHQQALREAIPKVNRILSIGWRGTEKYFLQLLAEGLKVAPNIYIVAGKKTEALSVGHQFGGAGIKGTFQYSDGGFSYAIGSRMISEWLLREVPR